MVRLYLSFGGYRVQFGTVVAEKYELQYFVTREHTHTQIHTHTYTHVLYSSNINIKHHIHTIWRVYYRKI